MVSTQIGELLEQKRVAFLKTLEDALDVRIGFGHGDGDSAVGMNASLFSGAQRGRSHVDGVSRNVFSAFFCMQIWGQQGIGRVNSIVGAFVAIENLGAISSASMDASDMFITVLFSGEAFTLTTLARGKGAEEGVFVASMHLVNLSLMAQETARVGKALKLFAAGGLALVGALVFVHVFARRGKQLSDHWQRIFTSIRIGGRR